jgi:translation initiation factor IF-2
MEKKNNQLESSIRPPVVAVLGHVDHGKTSLLDYIRNASVASKEHGGITQHIGAYQVEISTGKRITFIDTPGHEAFAKMRSRGASVADIAILVVAADDSVKPQTIESIEQSKRANIPLIVAINKIDLPTANIQKVKQDLARNGVQLEGFGGDTPFVQVSAKSGQGISELLSLIQLVWELRGGAPIDTRHLEGNVIETRVDKGKGKVATIVVKTGILAYATALFENDVMIGKVRALENEWGIQVKEARPGTPVQVAGFNILPDVGSIVTDKPVKKPVVSHVSPVSKPFIPDFLKPLHEIEQKLTILLKTDTAGSLEAIKTSLSQKIDIAGTGFGDITEADVLTASSSRAFIVGFNVGIRPQAAKLADTEKVLYRTYTIIYELLDELADVVAGMKEIVTGEREVGQAIILAEFPFDRDRIAGVQVNSGRLAKGDIVRLVRAEQEIARGKIKSLRQGKHEVTKVEEGKQCGVLFDKPLAFSLQDAIIAVIK